MEIRFYHLILFLVFSTDISSASFGYNLRIPRESVDYSFDVQDMTPWKSNEILPTSKIDGSYSGMKDENPFLKSPLKRVPKTNQKPSYSNYRTFQLLGQWHLVRDKLGRKEQQLQKDNNDDRKPQVVDVAQPGIIETSGILEDEIGPIVPAKLTSIPDLDPELILSSDDSKRNAQNPRTANLQKDGHMVDHNIFGFTSSHWGPLGKRDNFEVTTLSSVGDKRTKNDGSNNRQVPHKWVRLLSFYLKHPSLARQVVAQQIAQRH